MTVRGIGVDAVDIPRFKAVLERRPMLTRRLFTEGELEEGAQGVNRAMHLAARFAAKEATFKALGVGLGSFEFRDVEVLKDAKGAPQLELSGRAASLARRRGVGHFFVSLTHTAQMAVATVVADGACAGEAGQ